jgi:D-sedoheptulose 7-phosphate isomerase
VIGPADLVDRRSRPGHALADHADAVAAACFAVADRFARGGTLLAFGVGASATDAQHVAVEFVHPVIVGKRALPALSLATDVATVTGVAATAGIDEVFAHQLAQLGGPVDIALGITASGDDRPVQRGLEAAHARGMLTVALTGGEGVGTLSAHPAVDHCIHVPSGDPLVVKEVHVTTYHVLWELVHVFFEQPGLLDGHQTECGSDVCITCSDQAVEVVVLELLGDDLARVDTGSGVEEVSVALVDAVVGDRILVHAGEAIAKAAR